MKMNFKALVKLMIKKKINPRDPFKAAELSKSNTVAVKMKR
jgi:hypothetical protein